MRKIIKAKRFLFISVLIFMIILSGAFLFIYNARSAGLLRNAAVAPATNGTDNLIGQTNAQWKFTMTNDTALAPGDVIQVDFPTVSNGPPFSFSNPSVVATSSATTTMAVAIGGQSNLRVAFTLLETLNASTTFSITMNGVNNPLGTLQNLQNLSWTFRTGTTTSGIATDTLTTVKDGPATATRSIVRGGYAIFSSVDSSISASSYTASATNVTYTFTFVATTSIPVGGKIIIHFPSEYSLLNATTSLQSNINGAGAGSPAIAAGAIATSTSNGRNDVILTTSNAETGAAGTVTVTVAGLINPALGVYRPIYIYTTNANNGLLDGSPFPDNVNDAYNGPPPVDAIHIGGTNNMTVSVYKMSGSNKIKLSAAEIAQVRVGVGCPDKQFFVGMRYLDSNGSTTFSNLLDCNYKVGVDGAEGNSSSFFNNFLKPGMVDVPAIGGVTTSLDLTFGVPDETWTGTITSGPTTGNGTAFIQAFDGQYEVWSPVYNSTGYTTQGFNGSGVGYFRFKVKTGSTWKINVMSSGTLTDGTDKFWPPVIPSTYASSTATTSLGSFAYVKADKTLTVTVKNGATNSTITTNTCVGVKRSGGGMFMGSQEMYCNANSGDNYVFKVPVGDITIEVNRPGVGKPEEYPIAVSNDMSKTINISAPTTYISVTVLDSSGTAINGAPVFANSSSGFGQAMTNSSGVATIYVPAGTYRVEGFAPGLGPLTAQTGVVVTNSSNPSVAFTVTTAGFKTIQGTVTQNSAGLGSVQIGARGYGATTGGNGTVTNSDGTYTLRVPAGTYKVGGWSQATGGLAEQTVDVSSSNATGVNWSLGASGTLRIIVAGGANVSPLFGGAFDNTTGRGNGTDTWISSSTTDKYADITLPAGTYEVHVGSPVTGELTPAGGDSITITGSQTTTKTYSVASVASLVALTGNVSSGGSNVSDANVWASRINGPGFYSTLTDSSGNYSLKVPDGVTYRVGVRKMGYVTADTEKAVAGASSQNFTLTAAGATITGTISGSSGALSNAWVSAKKTGSDTWTNSPTDATGAYSLSVDTGSAWTIYADGPCYLRSTGLAASAGDSGKNITLTTNSNCTAPTPQVSGLTPSTGGMVTNGDKLKVDIPANALGTGQSTVSISVQDAELAVASSNAAPLQSSVQTITATDSSGQAITSLNSDVTITLQYQESDLPVGFDENNLQMAYFDATTGQWEPVAATVDTTLNTLTASVDHFTDYGGITPRVPDAPENLAAAAASASQINLTWNATTITDYYDVYRSTSSGGTYTAIGSSTSASYSSAGLAADTTYYYKITAVNDSGASAYSSGVSATTNPGTTSSSGGGIIQAPAFSVSDNNLWIDGKPMEVSSREIILKFSVSDATHVAISNSSNFDNITWEAYATSKSWTLTAGDGTKNIYVKFRNSAGTASAVKILSVKLKGQGFVAQENLTAPASARTDGSLIKYAASDKVYVLENGKKRWVKTAEIFNSLGYDWKKIIVVADSEKFDDGADKNSFEKADGTLIKYAGDLKVYVLEGGKKRWIPSAEVFSGLGYDWKKIIVISDNEKYEGGTDKTINEKAATASGGKVVFAKTLNPGMKGEEIKQLQQKLKDMGYYPVDMDITGYFGAKTKEAIIKLQKANNIEPVGIVGPKTRARLNE